jgi:uncharacterized protein GlcG (DUF336 family)
MAAPPRRGRKAAANGRTRDGALAQACWSGSPGHRGNAVDGQRAGADAARRITAHGADDRRTAIAECEKTGNDVSVAVVDRAGRLRGFLQGDKAAPHNIELAQRKAYTARTFGRTSAEWAERTGPNLELAGQRELEHVIPLRGGVPIKVGNETIGAVGVSGSTSGGDEGCAIAGVAKVADQLK